MEFALILLFVIFFITIILLLQSSRQKFLDFILFCFVGIAIDIICKDVFNISGFWYYMCDLAGLISLELAYVFYTMHTETTIISAKAKQIKLFGTSNVIKTKNNKTFTINNDIFIQWHAKKLNKQIHTGHKYKITTYRLLFSDRNILSATEIKKQRRVS